VADDRRDAALNRGDRGRDHHPAASTKDGMTLILASASPSRRAVLTNAGLSFEIVPATIDERAAEKPLVDAGATSDDIAAALAMAKAVNVSEARHGDLVIGADTVIELNGERLNKPADMEAARHQLLKLSGKTHLLHSAVACARNGTVAWHHVETAVLTLRKLTPTFIGHYLAAVGEEITKSVGCYQLEGRGVQLFEKVEGDFFTILGLPLLPLLAFLRSEGVVE
jgi:septum formation protein